MESRVKDYGTEIPHCIDLFLKGVGCVATVAVVDGDDHHYGSEDVRLGPDGVWDFNFVGDCVTPTMIDTTCFLLGIDPSFVTYA